ncbi:unnamed protein product [Ceutorhynchus assimilis]|uniref:Enhancer of yellow 2 transcription factor n=1 Tax=Ceutorhynchus assimilis TaxID=467358 RepID=A0A9N9MPZ0_9CUCU|nr:unnamed protein product [Ceutorhynchus assimilis]
MSGKPENANGRVSMHLDVNNGLERVTELIETRLIESGWKDRVKLACREAITENNQNVPSVDHLIEVITPKARALVPDAVKRELLHEIEMIFSNIEKGGYTTTLDG